MYGETVKTTLVLDDELVRALKVQAAMRRTTMSSLVETALRDLLGLLGEPTPVPTLPVFHAGVPQVDLADRDSLDDAMRDG